MIPQTEASYQKDKAELEELRVKETKLNEQVSIGSDYISSLLVYV